MKRLLALCILVLTLSACHELPDAPVTSVTPITPATSAPSTTPAPVLSPKPKAGETDFIITESQLFPPEQVLDPDFEPFYKDFSAAVNNHDARFLDSILDDKVWFSYGGESGKDEFYAFFAEQDVWAVLQEILDLGGIFYKPNTYAPGKCFVAPYTYTNFPRMPASDLDAYDYFIIIDQGVPVYDQASAASETIDTLDYNIAEFRYSDAFLDKGPDDFVSVTTLSGAVGFVQKKHLRSAVGYRLCIEQKDDGWKLTMLVAGD